ncbi:S-adenosyl-L-homocysteine hydrolase [Croceicoccus bisphenolivorans]|uniref:S-adenosyl-L-homocysteine hydrolase n=1 Tax=Croceicoccus bisphenolivorans TaxID=1783232 RepID=UPI000A54C6A1|nr:S-adenosyl-L-homocysteine hydrolase [Croceicoccus bisphenolivorans]
MLNDIEGQAVIAAIVGPAKVGSIEMGTLGKIIAAAASAGMVAGAVVPARAAASDYVSAEKLRKLDIMLMVTALRCRHGGDNFQRDYEKFSIKHNVALQGAAKSLQASYTGKYGAKGAKRQLDKISVSMANQYGQGHPWLECAELKQVTHDLAADRDSSRLLAVADQLLANSRPAKFAMSR